MSISYGLKQAFYTWCLDWFVPNLFKITELNKISSPGTQIVFFFMYKNLNWFTIYGPMSICTVDKWWNIFGFETRLRGRKNSGGGELYPENLWRQRNHSQFSALLRVCGIYPFRIYLLWIQLNKYEIFSPNSKQYYTKGTIHYLHNLVRV